MHSRSEAVLADSRNNLRVKENRNVSWHVKNSGHKGRAKIRNISASGMLIETNGTFVPPVDNCIFTFDSTLGHNNYIPQTGELVWSKRKGVVKNKHLCGVRFIEPGEYVLTNLRKHVQKGILKFTNTRRLTVGMNIALVAAIIALTAYTLWLSSDIYKGMQTSNERMLATAGHQAAVSRNFAQLYQDSQLKLAAVTEELGTTKNLYQESAGQLKNVSQELSETKLILAQTEAFLLEAKNSSQKLEDKLAAVVSSNEAEFAQKRNVFDDQIAMLQEKNILLETEMTQIKGDMADLKNEINQLEGQVSFYEGDVKNIEEGRVLMNIYRDRMKQVKSKIKVFKKEVASVRRDVLRERDRIQLSLGNNGYFVKNGEKVVVDMQKYNAATPEPTETAEVVGQIPQPKAAPKVEVTVTNFD